ncbi:MAG: hypothetical protein WD876_01970, partial [Candidatus Pacearchaeota archaeon]
IVATKINPLIDVNFIDHIGITGQYPNGVSGVGFLAPDAALGRADGKLENVVLENIGYAVIRLKQQPNESAMPDFVSGNLTAKIRYNIENALGVGNAVFYLPLINDDSEWQKNYESYGFWQGKGFLRAEGIDNDGATISLYAGSDYRQSPAKLTSVDLKKGEKSYQIPMPGFDYCMASLELELKGLENPDKRAKFTVNADVVEAAAGEKFLNGKCEVLSTTKAGIIEKTRVRCKEDSSSGIFGSSPFDLEISPKINMTIDGEQRVVGVGDYLYDVGGRYIYVGHIGSVKNSRSINDVFLFLVNTTVRYPDGKLTADEIARADSIADYYRGSEKSTGIVKVDDIRDILKTVTGTLLEGLQRVVTGDRYYFLRYDPIEGEFGKRVRIIDFAGPIDVDIDAATRENYENAMQDYDTVINRFSGEQYENVVLGEQAFVRKIELAEASGQKRTMVDLCEEFSQIYPTSNSYILNKCSDSIKLSNSQSSVKHVEINGKTHKISFEGVYLPSLDEFSATLKIDNAGIVSAPRMGKDQIIDLDVSTGETIVLDKINDDGSAVFSINYRGGILGTVISNKDTLRPGVELSRGKYKFTLQETSVQKVAKVSVNPRINYAGTEVTFPFKIGIEKRGLKLSPEQAKDKIKSIDERVKKFENIYSQLDKINTGLKTACIATEFLFTAENFLANLGGEGIARARVMKDPMGWYDKCKEMIKGTDNTLQQCLFKNSALIENDVKRYSDAIASYDDSMRKLQQGITVSGGLLSADIVNTTALISRLAPVVQADISALGSTLQNPRNTAESINLEEAKTDLSYEVWKARNNYNLEDLREIGLYAKILRSNRDDVAAQQKLYSLLSSVKVNSKNYAEAKNLADSYGIPGEKVTFLETKKDVKQLPYLGNTYTKIKSTFTLPGNVDSITSQNLKEDAPIEIIQTEFSEQKYIVVLDDSERTGKMPIKQISDDKFMIYDLAGNLAENPPLILKGGVYFKKYDIGSYTNRYNNPEVRYYETEPYKGWPEVVPFDTEKGWYAGLKQTLPVLSNLRSYDESGRVNSLWLCNVGENGNEEFFRGGDDICHQINLAERKTYGEVYGLNPSEIPGLVNRAVSAVEKAQKAHKDGASSVTIDGKVYRVGEPASDAPEIQCTDVMSPQQCQILFNVCDPVICPSSRCNLGGQYSVRDVIQSGFIGSALLCLPNAREGIIIPVCLTGINAALDGWIQIEKSHRSCLQEQIETGKTVGICDEIYSVYACEFAWRQGLPAAKAIIPNLIGSLLGQNVRGGGEYLSAKDAFSNAEKSFDFFTQYYAKNSFDAFKARSLEEAGTPLCKNLISLVYPRGANLIDGLTR